MFEIMDDVLRTTTDGRRSMGESSAQVSSLKITLLGFNSHERSHLFGRIFIIAIEALQETVASMTFLLTLLQKEHFLR